MMGPTTLPAFTITKLNRDAGHWTARVSVNGDTIKVDRQYGSWQATVRDRPRVRSFHRADVHPRVAAALQAKVRPIEKKEAKQ